MKSFTLLFSRTGFPYLPFLKKLLHAFGVNILHMVVMKQDFAYIVLIYYFLKFMFTSEMFPGESSMHANKTSGKELWKEHGNVVSAEEGIILF